MGLQASQASGAPQSLGYGLGLILYHPHPTFQFMHVSARGGGGTRVVMRFPLAS